jgi:hypothetical protein
MSMIVYYRPLPPDDGAEVPLDLHAPGTRRFLFTVIYMFIDRDGFPPLVVSLLPSFPVAELMEVEGFALFLTRDGLWVEYRVIDWTDHYRMERDSSGFRLVQVNDLREEYRQVNPGYVAALFHAAKKPIIPELKTYSDLSRLATVPYDKHPEWGMVEPDPYAALDGGNQAPVPPAALVAPGHPTPLSLPPPSGNGTASMNGRALDAPAELPDLVTLNQAALAEGPNGVLWDAVKLGKIDPDHVCTFAPIGIRNTETGERLHLDEFTALRDADFNEERSSDEAPTHSAQSPPPLGTAETRPERLIVMGIPLPFQRTHPLLKVPTGRVYVRDKDDLGEEPVDLDGCRVYRLADPDIDGGKKYLNVYYTKDRRWIQHIAEVPFDEFPEAWSEMFADITARQAACLIAEWTDGYLPQELDPFRESADRTDGQPGSHPAMAEGRKTFHNHERDRFIYQQRLNGVALKEILVKLKGMAKEEKWETLGTKQAVSLAIRRYCERTGQPRPSYK